MRDVLINYEPVNPTTWAYLASLLMIAVYFKFNRVFSLRNLDLAGLILLAPPLLMIQFGQQHADTSSTEHAGYIWLYSVSGLFLLRLLLDALMVRRPLLEPNLSVGGLTFLGVSLFMFLMGNVVTGTPSAVEVAGSQQAANIVGGPAPADELNSFRKHGPGHPWFYLLPHILTQSVLGDDAKRTAPVTDDKDTKKDEDEAKAPATASFGDVVTARVVAILSQFAIVLGLVLVGVRHFDNVKTGIAAATLYLLMPYTAMWTGSGTHALPGAIVVWAIVFYRWPLFAGAMLGLAFGTFYYALFLLPLWGSFYWQRGLRRFLVGLVVMIIVIVSVDALVASDTQVFLAHMRQMFGVALPKTADLSGVWGRYWQEIYRLPIIAAQICLSLSLALWPAHKNLGTLIAYSGAMMLGTQFWHPHSGSVAIAWYLPLLLLTTFRPNLEDRVAASVVR
jgi:hypothetical protein